MVAGIHDMIVYPVDTKWVRDNLGEVLVEYVEVNGGHTTFFLGTTQKKLVHARMCEPSTIISKT